MKKNLLAFCFILLGFTSLYAQNKKKDSIIDRPVYESPNMSSSPPDSMKIYTVVQVKPKFYEKLDKYIHDSIRYPQEAKEKGIKGTVYVSFIIEKDGSISSITVLRSPDTSLNNEATRLISTMPRWTPGKQNGAPIRVRDMIPVHFKLE